MSTIPNVSSVYRDLSSIYTTAGMTGNLQYPNNYSLQSKVVNEKTCFEDMYSYKQKRHNQLMSKLKNSYQQHNQLVGGLQSASNNPSQYSSFNKTYTPTQSYFEKPSYISNSYNSNLNNSYSSTPNRASNFVIPQIRYRHIQDQKQKNNENQRSNIIYQQKNEKSYVQQYRPREVEQLQQQFYEDQNSKRVQGNKQSRQKQIGIQAKKIGSYEDIDGKSELSNRTNGFARQNRNGKYQQKIQNYYELCRKNLTSKQQEPQKIKQQKFMRGTNTKNKAMKLDQAIKLLSLD